MRVAIVGGGPGGLMAARFLEQQSNGTCQITLFEASHRLGGKIQTRRFSAAPVRYEAGVAECYDVEAFGPDPLKALVRALGLLPLPTQSKAVALDGVILRDDAAVAGHYGERTWAAIEQFRREAAARMAPGRWHAGFSPLDNQHPWAHRTCADMLDRIDDANARRYLSVVMHSDLACEPHQTNGLVGLRNILKNVAGFGAQYRIAGGMEMFPRRLAARLTRTHVQLSARVVRLCADGGRYALDVRRGRELERQWFDAVVLALPYGQLGRIEWAGERLRRAVIHHIARYDQPAHFLRVSLLFDRPFWRDAFAGSWLMLDAFNGCCVYDECGADAGAAYGVLGWLLAGSDALAHVNADDATLVRRVIESLPDPLYGRARRCLIEGKVHRWAGALSATPGGFPLQQAAIAHRIAPLDHPRLIVTGDYLVDSTLNGVCRSAHLATDLLLERDGRRGRPPADAYAA